METALLIIGWGAWALTAFLGLWFAYGIRQTAIRGGPCPTWPTLSIAFCFCMLAVLFLFLPLHKAHLTWLLPVLWVVGLRVIAVASFTYIPLLSKAVIWPAYLFARFVLIGTGVHLRSPLKNSPWAHSDNASSMLDPYEAVASLAQLIDSDPRIAAAAQKAMTDIGAGQEPAKAEIGALLDEIDNLVEQWDKESDEFTIERRKIIDCFYTKRDSALASTETKTVRANIEQNFKEREIKIGTYLEKRAARLNALLDEINRKKDIVTAKLDPVELDMLKQYNDSWRE
ncbi:MAG: hypothetical protein K8R91_05980 [Phycisphaerae bacterium]|nr:hypothetical protein [Phycisphaerae bacterium]